MECLLLAAIIIAVAICAVAPDYAGQRNADALQSVKPVNSTSKYENPSHTLTIEYPFNWKVMEDNDTTFKISSLGVSPSNFTIHIFPRISGAIPLNQLIASNILSLKQHLTNFQLLDSNATNIDGNQGYKVVYSFQRDHHSIIVMRMWTRSVGTVYHLIYASPSEEYPIYLPIIQKIIVSLKIAGGGEGERTVLVPQSIGFKVGNQPYDITVDPDTNKIYIANYGSNSVSVIDAVTDKLISTIKGLNAPSSVYFNPTSKSLYVTNSGNDTVSVIDTSINKKIPPDIHV